MKLSDYLLFILALLVILYALSYSSSNNERFFNQSSIPLCENKDSCGACQIYCDGCQSSPTPVSTITPTPDPNITPTPGLGSGPSPGTGVCPAWINKDISYTYDKNEWGDLINFNNDLDLGWSGKDNAINGPGPQSTACAWVAACEGDKDCIKNCPRALEIAFDESKFHPYAQSYDGVGRGLFQIGGDEAGPHTRGLGGSQCETKNGGGGSNADVNECEAYDPIKNAKVAIELTDGGRHWRPEGGHWNACNQDGTTKAMTGSGANHFKGENGDQIAKGVCKKAAESVNVQIDDKEWSTFNQCTNGNALNGTVYKCPNNVFNTDDCGPNGIGWKTDLPITPPFTTCKWGYCQKR